MLRLQAKEYFHICLVQAPLTSVCVSVESRRHVLHHAVLQSCSPGGVLCSAAVLGYALESFVDVWSSILVLWRFWGDGSSEAAAAMAQREKWASFGISMSVSARISPFACPDCSGMQT